MSSNQENHPHSVYGLENVRSISTIRGMYPEGPRELGVFPGLGISLVDVMGKKLLDVGTGGGKLIRDARQLGLDIVGVDIIPAIELVGDPEDLHKKDWIKEAQEELARVANDHPSRVIAADAGSGLPFRDNTFDIVLSHRAMPDYAQNPKEIAVSILEMIRVARERVLFSGDDFDGEYYEGYSEFGSGKETFRFDFKHFLQFLTEEYNIPYRLYNPSPMDVMPAFQFDVTGKPAAQLKEDRLRIIHEAQKLIL